MPDPTPAAEGRLTYDGTVEFRRRLRVAGYARPGPTVAACTLGFQACDAFSCQPPDDASLEATIEVVGP